MVAYEEYMRSPEWRRVRRRYFRSKLPQGCQGCGARQNLHLHHKTYERLGHEELTDLVPVCQVCHALIHWEFDRATGDLWAHTEWVLERIRTMPDRAEPPKPVGRADPNQAAFDAALERQEVDAGRVWRKKSTMPARRVKRARIAAIEAARNAHYAASELRKPGPP